MTVDNSEGEVEHVDNSEGEAEQADETHEREPIAKNQYTYVSHLNIL